MVGSQERFLFDKTECREHIGNVIKTSHFSCMRMIIMNKDNNEVRVDANGK